MKIKEPEFRFGKNWDELATLFNYKINEHDQDWTYIIAEPTRIDEYISAYGTTVINEDTKFSLLEMIIQSLTDQATEELIQEKWKEIKPLLIKDFELHKYTIFYWCCWDNEDINDCWRVTPLFREFWLNKK
ncbi:hypothetical protein [uncultured Kordia sp.]|uniref:hypothetical protein n=1 Tax=uncultured Kordia sp. TaxID=507699 RepID=UPI0026255195|nr:hypothetical protein [uncultured Kordia sp.]